MNSMHNIDIMPFSSLYFAQIVLISPLLSRFSPGGRRASYPLNIVRLEIDIDWVFVNIYLLMFNLLYLRIYVHNMC